MNTRTRENKKSRKCNECQELVIKYFTNEAYCRASNGKKIRLRIGQHKPKWCPKRSEK